MVPVSARRAERPFPVTVAAGVLCVDGLILIGQRRADERHPLQWEFPGGKLEPGEDARGALVRELREELDVTAAVGPVLHFGRHRYDDGSEVDLVFLQVDAIDRRPSNMVFADLRWVTIASLGDFDFLAGDMAFVTAIRAGSVVPGPTTCGTRIR